MHQAQRGTTPGCTGGQYQERQKSQLSEITLKRWRADYKKATTPAEHLIVLTPGKREVVKLEQIAWLHDYLAYYRKPSGCSMKEAYADFCTEWQRRYARHADEPLMLAALLPMMPCYMRWRNSPETVKQRGRKTGNEYRQLEGFIRHDWTSLPVNYFWIGGGHGMKMKVAHPDHGQPFSPEVTFIYRWQLPLYHRLEPVALRERDRRHRCPALWHCHPR